MLKDRWPYENLRVKPFGSSASGLDSDKSDLDLCITVPLHQFTDDIYNKWNLDRMPNSYYNMHRVAQSLRQIGMRNVVPVPTAKVPICKFTDPQFNIECDINTNNTLGIINSRLIKCYTQLDHRVKPFLYVIKHFVKTREINNPTMGTLSSYAYVLIALYYLMTCNPPVIPNLQTLANCSHPSCSSNKLDTCLALNKRRPTYYDVVYHDSVKLVHRTHPAYSMSTATNPSKYCTVWEGYNSDSVGQLLVSFFQWFVNLNHKACAMSFKLGCMISRKTYHWGGHCIAIQDPFIMERNVAVSCSGFGYKHIIEEFSRATDALLQNHPLQSVFAPAIVYSYQDNMEAILESPQHRIMRQKQINEMEKALRRLNKSIAANAAANASNVRATVQIESVRTATPPSHQVPSGGRQNSTAASSGQQQQRRNGGRTSNQKRSSYERDKEMFEKALAVSDEDYYDDDDDWDDMPLTYHDWVQGLAPAPPRGNVSMRDLFGPEYYNDEDYDEEEDDLPNRPYSGDDISDDVLQTALLFSLLSTNPSQPNIDHELVDRIEAVLPALSAAAARNMAQDSRSGAAPATAHEVPDSYWKDDTPSICTLLDVPSYIDELQVIDALSEYGQVLDVVQFDSVDHFVVGLISWEIMIMLHDDVDDLPQYIDFGGGLRIPVE
ncbi:uncharacterized protein BYT42DRAFT_275064 [Radiomyces spectabilis]|uniref:uncharacterized protein n=1 Tax=Radiomyces spectabilis TaxID=64574 RepID=UPI00221F4237|nr:uncharacterized protein BYT42DRAFT_275064 [Radiomyces spectabilis]KAI8384806.1 hypothetical protein BYT42DRAFT_275064 [Radiomyces spectabilis]